MLLNDTHNQELLEIVGQNPADIVAILDHIENTLGLFPEKLTGRDQKTLKFCIKKSFDNAISHFQSTGQFEAASELLNELKKLWEDLFHQTLDSKTNEEEMDSDSNYEGIVSDININLKEKITIEEIDTFLNIWYSNIINVHNDFLPYRFLKSEPELFISLQVVKI